MALPSFSPKTIHPPSRFSRTLGLQLDRRPLDNINLLVNILGVRGAGGGNLLFFLNRDVAIVMGFKELDGLSHGIARDKIRGSLVVTHKIARLLMSLVSLNGFVGCGSANALCCDVAFVIRVTAHVELLVICLHVKNRHEAVLGAVGLKQARYKVISAGEEVLVLVAVILVAGEVLRSVAHGLRRRGAIDLWVLGGGVGGGLFSVFGGHAYYAKGSSVELKNKRS